MAELIQDRSSGDYCLEVPFDPPNIFPELLFLSPTNPRNGAYQMVRGLLAKLELDKKNIGTDQWNPLGQIIRPGNKVLIKPNLVTPKHYLGRRAAFSTIVHGSILRPIIDYAVLALRGSGSITIADNPVESAPFDELMQLTGIGQMVSELTTRGYRNLRVVDLRPKLIKESKAGKFYHSTQAGDPQGYITIDLAENSLFHELDGIPDIHYYTLADQTVDHFDPRYFGESATDKYHNSRNHKYVVSGSILDSDVIINVAKLKTHCKSGVTLTLKNMIGMVYLKECMPHHRPGPPPDGDSFPFYPASHYVAARKLYKSLREHFQIHRFPGFRVLRNLLQRKGILIQQHLEHGNWRGNDTIWRTILDLNRIAVYADKNGIMRDTPQRRFLFLVDGIVGQEGNGPMSGDPVNASTLLGGFNPVAVDTLAASSMGINPEIIPAISRASGEMKWSLCPKNGREIKGPQPNRTIHRFRLPKGWI